MTILSFAVVLSRASEVRRLGVVRWSCSPCVRRPIIILARISHFCFSNVVSSKVMRSRQSLKPIRFQGQLLPDWAQLLDLAASLSSMPESTRQWFSRFTTRTGVDDARTVVEHSQILSSGLRTHRDSVLAALERGSGDSTPATIHAAWLYALDTMIEGASGIPTCTWHVEGTDDDPGSVGEDGDITLRRV